MSRLMIAVLSLVCAGLVPTGPASAEVIEQSDAGFVLRLSVDARASGPITWQALTDPRGWWSGEHTYSGDAANLSLDARAAGCFCETLFRSPGTGPHEPTGSIEHMHVVYADPERGVLRMVGGLGPLQGDAVHGTLTISLKPIDGGTRIEWVYVVGGFMRMRADQIAPLVDKVLGEQVARLALRAERG